MDYCIQAALKEAYRVLRSGGRIMILEFSHVQNPLLRQIYDTYSFNVIPRIGGLVANDSESYQYLVESIRRFPTQVSFSSLLDSSISHKCHHHCNVVHFIFSTVTQDYHFKPCLIAPHPTLNPLSNVL
jgi:ubiquinone/menaquinone biosynthesis C-methylase UbiE